MGFYESTDKDLRQSLSLHVKGNVWTEMDVKGVPLGFENDNLALYARFLPRITVTVAFEF